MRVGPYEVAGEVGRGATGVVYRARSPDGRVVALKLLVRPGEEALARFERERRLLASFTERQGFVPLLDAGVDPRGPYLVMPFVPGGTLRARLEKGALGIEETLELGHVLAVALGHAHARGIVHRDLKPENVLFGKDGRPLVVDLGLAKHFRHDVDGASQSAHLSRTGSFRGTVAYMPPEQMEDSVNVGPTVDVYALGAILYECLAGKPAFSGLTPLHLITQVTLGRVEPLRRLRPDAPGGLVLAIETALGRDPTKRYPDGAAFGRALFATPSRGGPARVSVVLGVLAAIAAIALTPAFFFARARPPARDLAAEHAAGNVEWSRAHEALVRGDRDAALTLINRAIQVDPSSGNHLAFRAEVWKRKGDLVKAIADIDSAMALMPGRATLFTYRGMYKQSLSDYEGALADYTRAVAIDPTATDAWNNRAGVQELLGNTREGVADLGRALAIDPDDLIALVNRGGAERNLGMFKEAAVDLDRAIALSPRKGKAWHYRGTIWAEQGDLDRAIACITRGFQFEPWDPSIVADLGTAKEMKGDLEGAMAGYEIAVAMAPSGRDAAKVRPKLEALRLRLR